MTKNRTEKKSQPTLHGSVSFKLLILTIAFVMTGALVFFVPTLGAVHRSWFDERFSAAHIAAIALKGSPDEEIAEAVREGILQDAGLIAILQQEGGARYLLISPPEIPQISRTIELHQSGAFTHMASALQALFFGKGQIVRASNAPQSEEGGRLEIIFEESALQETLLDYSGTALEIMVAISALTALFLFLSTHRILVRPLKRLISNMAAFREAPENSRLILRARPRHDEIGETEKALADMQIRIHESFHHKNRLAALGVAVNKINHDLRNILSSVQLISDRLQESSDPAVQRIAPRLLAAIGRASALCARTLEYGRFEPSVRKAERIHLRSLVEDAGEAASLPKGGVIRWVNEVPPDLYIEGNPQHLFRILLNLGRNATEAIGRMEEIQDPPGRITVSAEEAAHEGKIHLSVEDTGPGLPEGMGENLFRPFVSGSKGSGLGLAISRELAQAQGGGLTLERSSEKGTRFLITLPHSEKKGAKKRGVKVLPFQKKRKAG